MSRIVPNILVVEDDNAFRDGAGEGVQATAATRPTVWPTRRGRSDAARRDSPEMAVVDLRLPDQSGLDVVRQLKAIDPSTAIVVLTGYGSIATALESVRLGRRPLPDEAHRRRSHPRRVPARPGVAPARLAPPTAVAGAGRMGAPEPRADRLRRQHLGGGAAARHAPPLAPAEAREVSGLALTEQLVRRLSLRGVSEKLELPVRTSVSSAFTHRNSESFGGLADQKPAIATGNEGRDVCKNPGQPEAARGQRDLAAPTPGSNFSL